GRAIAERGKRNPFKDPREVTEVMFDLVGVDADAERQAGQLLHEEPHLGRMGPVGVEMLEPPPPRERRRGLSASEPKPGVGLHRRRLAELAVEPSEGRKIAAEEYAGGGAERILRRVVGPAE